MPPSLSFIDAGRCILTKLEKLHYNLIHSDGATDRLRHVGHSCVAAGLTALKSLACRQGSVWHFR